MIATERLSFTNRRWQRRSEGAPPSAAMAAAYGRIVAQLLAARGVESLEDARNFLDPGLHRLSDPFALRGVSEAAERIARALAKGERIAVYGDYDVDGQSAAALMVRLLTSFGAEVTPYIPRRIGEGYGLHVQALEALAEAGCSLVVTVDCGIAAAEEAAWAKRRGLDLIITDHHEPQERLPEAVAVINPHLDPGYPHPYLAGCGVAFKLAEALAERVAGDRSLAHRYVELVALGTVADVVPLLGENRSLVRAGLLKMNGAGEIPGIEALRRAAGVQGELTAAGIGFILGPRLNAAGRVGDPALGLRLLLADTLEEAMPLAEALDACNAERRRLEEEVLAAARSMVEQEHRLPRDRGIVVAGEGWHQGVVGIAAARLVEAYHRPALVIAIEGDVARGSGRSIPGFDLFAALSECSDLFDAFGGHAAAAGFTLPAGRIGSLRERFLAVTGERLRPEDLVPSLIFDAYVDLDEVNFELIKALEALEPFGAENPAPLFVARGVRLSGRAVGRDASHLKMSIASPGGSASFDGIAFSLAHALLGRLEEEHLYDIIFVPEVNVWNERRSLQLQVKDVRLAEESAARPAHAAAGHEAPREPARVVGRPRRPIAPEELPARMPVEAAGRRDWAGLLEELLEAGWAVYVVPGPPERSGELGERLVHSLSPVWRQRLFWAPPSSGKERERAAQATSEWPWAVVARLPLSGEALAEWRVQGGRAAGDGLAILLCGLPESRKELLRHLLGAAAWEGRLRCLLAYGREGVEATKEALLRAYPDRERLALAYAALRACGGQGATAGELWAVIERRRPGAATPGGVRFALAIFEELGLAEQSGGRWRLSSQAPAKVDLEKSLRYNGGNVRRMEFASYAEALLECPPGDFFTTLLGRGAGHGFEGAGA